MTRLAKYDTAATLKKKCIALTPKINQPAESGGGNLPLSGAVAQLREKHTTSALKKGNNCI